MDHLDGASSGIAEQIMADHGEEAGVDVALLAALDLSAAVRILSDAPTRHAAQHVEGDAQSRGWTDDRGNASAG